MGGSLRDVPVGGGRKNKRAKTGHNSSNDANGSNRQQQQQVAVPLGVGEIDGTIFSDILQQIMFQPQPEPPLFPPPSNLSTSPYGFEGQELVSSNEESLFALMDGWLQETVTQPAESYWNCWHQHGMMGFGASGIKPSAPNESL